ncbi:hypothetical protein, partial [Gordonia sp. (in: high G+C Gram-positive bacteria)]|uniref:hypothetical protein n=1 Tax=Gordonia sp. (in: high G+C Gram-positive bacteria) TaxID=84139 RepID=UPI002579F9A8
RWSHNWQSRWSHPHGKQSAQGGPFTVANDSVGGGGAPVSGVGAISAAPNGIGPVILGIVVLPFGSAAAAISDWTFDTHRKDMRLLTRERCSFF